VAFAQTDSSLGTWRLNVEKSEFGTGRPPKSDTRVFEPWEQDGVRSTRTAISADGTQTASGYAAHYDGRDYPYQGTTADTISLRRVDQRTVESTLKLKGQVVQSTRSVISEDGRTMTVYSASKNAQGQPVERKQIFEKQ
jgi:hypothetical protein